MVYKDRLSKRWYKATVFACTAWLNFYHKIKVTGEENIPEKGPALMLVKHQTFGDIPLEGIITYKQTRRIPYYVMRDTLPRCLEYVGGVITPRIKDMPQDKDKKKEWVRYAQDLKKGLLDFLNSKLNKGKMIIIHPEMTRCLNFVGEIKADLVRKLVNYDGLAVIPMGIRYHGPEFRSLVEVNIGKALSAEQKQDKNFYSIIREQLAELSNLGYSTSH